MINPHFIVGAGRRCMCGNYGGEDITCADILADLQGLVGTAFLPARRIRKVLWALREDCENPIVIDEHKGDGHE